MHTGWNVEGLTNSLGCLLTLYEIFAVIRCSTFNGIQRGSGEDYAQIPWAHRQRQEFATFLGDHANMQVVTYKHIGLLRFEGEAGSNLGGGHFSKGTSRSVM